MTTPDQRRALPGRGRRHVGRRLTLGPALGRPHASFVAVGGERGDESHPVAEGRHDLASGRTLARCLPPGGASGEGGAATGHAAVAVWLLGEDRVTVAARVARGLVQAGARGRRTLARRRKADRRRFTRAVASGEARRAAAYRALLRRTARRRGARHLVQVHARCGHDGAGITWASDRFIGSEAGCEELRATAIRAVARMTVASPLAWRLVEAAAVRLNTGLCGTRDRCSRRRAARVGRCTRADFAMLRLAALRRGARGLVESVADWRRASALAAAALAGAAVSRDAATLPCAGAAVSDLERIAPATSGRGAERRQDEGHLRERLHGHDDEQGSYHGNPSGRARAN